VVIVILVLPYPLNTMRVTEEGISRNYSKEEEIAFIENLNLAVELLVGGTF